MTGYDSKRQMASDKVFDLDGHVVGKVRKPKPTQEQNTITFSTSADWVMRITADRRIEVNEGVEVTEAAKKVLEALQSMLKPAQEPVAFDEFLESQDFYELMQTYRHCLTDALLPFEEVKNALRAAHIGKMK